MCMLSEISDHSVGRDVLQRGELEKAVQEREREMGRLREEREEAVKAHTAMESRLADLQVQSIVPQMYKLFSMW